MKLYKVLGENGEAINGGSGEWLLPKHGPGKWMSPVKGKIIPCENGYHLCRRSDLIDWLGPTVWEAEYRGELKRDDDKVVVRQARLIRKLDTWNKTTARLFAADCAEHTLFIFEQEFPNDPRPRQATEAARAFARGEISPKDLNTARDAARDAARAAWAAAGSLAAAWAAAESAAWAAAWSAARSAARSAAWSAARSWQTRRLFEYLDGKRC